MIRKNILFYLIIFLFCACGASNNHKSGNNASSNESKVAEKKADDGSMTGNEGTAASAQGARQGKTGAFFPLTVGNYWIYSNKNAPDEPETLRVTGTRTFEGNTVYELSNSLLFYEKNDTVYGIQLQRGGTFSHPQYFPVDKSTEYQFMIGGDVVTTRSAMKIDRPYKVLDMEYKNCYRYEQAGRPGEKNYDIIAHGIGFVEMNNEGRHLLLKEYHLEK